MKKTLHVTLDVHQPSVVELTVGDRVQLDRIVPSERGAIAERRGDLLGPGATTLSLEKGRYSFRTLSDANLKVVCGGVEAAISSNDKDEWPDPTPLPVAKGDDLPGEQPRFTLLGNERPGTERP